jgi:hypothetical protein
MLTKNETTPGTENHARHEKKPRPALNKCRKYLAEIQHQQYPETQKPFHSQHCYPFPISEPQKMADLPDTPSTGAA